MKHSEAMRAATSAPKPQKSVSSCATMTRPVFLTDAATLSKSSGCIVRRSSTSTSMPSSASSCAAR